ncbi:hypothetical protein [Sphingomonas radiodurans]|uniref:hypothetical protein n=1 Tax=Sphingomonas radiodurans TaxID=2890321 RepID=UPI001E2F7821|nr:hypothetical protein [Sphingomonas radiodurans]WBH15162.1 hypothetical protein LLW23_09835 [Sphingomonas radiodurans]
MNWVVFAASLVAVLALGGIAAWLKLGRSEPVFTAPDAAMRAAEEAITGFVAVSAAVASDGRAALVFGEGMRVVVLKAHGAHSAAREIVWHDVRASHEGMVVSTGDRRFGTVLVAGIDNLDIRRLAPQLTRV